MTDPVQTWHYGLVARWWAEFNTEGPEIAYFQALIERFGQPALDLACGTGRLLIPFLRAGLDVDGCDISADMIRLCREKAEREGLAPRLYVQPMHELALPGKYRTIVVCGGFGIGGTRQQDQESLRRIFQHLEPGGTLLLDNYLPYEDAEDWQCWLPENRQKLPEPWPASGHRKRAANGDELELRRRVAAMDPLDQVATQQISVELWRDGQMVQREERSLLNRFYFRNELLDMLAAAGFDVLQVLEGYAREAATPDSRILVFIARRPGEPAEAPSVP